MNNDTTKKPSTANSTAPHIASPCVPAPCAPPSTPASPPWSSHKAYTVVFGATTVSLLVSQMRGHFSSLNWLNVALFAALFCGYAWFSLFERISTFATPRRAPV